MGSELDNLSKTGSTVKARLCTMGNSSTSTEFSKYSIQFKSPTCSRDTGKTILSLVPDNKWTLSSFGASSAFFQGDMFVKNPEGPGFLLLNAILYGL